MKPGSFAGVLVLAGCVALCAAADVAADAVTRHVRGPAGPGQRSLDQMGDTMSPTLSPTLPPTLPPVRCGFSCAPGQENDAGLCYPPCRDGYTGAGPVCWSLTKCPSGYRDDGLYCFKPDSYGRGVGTPISISTKCSYYKGTKVIKSCKTTSTCGSKEECIGLCYNSCRDGYYAAGCNVCSAHCPSGMTDIGVSCMKGSYGRGMGKVPDYRNSTNEDDCTSNSA
jgi:hypothetical protein